MSNQVYSNTYGSGTRYLPRGGESDFFTLTKNVPAAPPVVSYGTQQKAITNAGVGLFFNRLNSVDAVATGNVWNYNSLQNPNTKQYWQLCANSDILSGTTLLYAKVDSVIAVNAVIPIRLPSGSGNLPVKFAAVVYGPDNVPVNTYCLANRDVPGGVTSNSTNGFCIDAVVPILAGQRIGVVAYSDANRVMVYEDDLNGTNNIVFQCSLTFTKL